MTDTLHDAIERAVRGALPWRRVPDYSAACNLVIATVEAAIRPLVAAERQLLDKVWCDALDYSYTGDNPQLESGREDQSKLEIRRELIKQSPLMEDCVTATVEQATRDWKERAEKAETELACCRIAARGWDQNPAKQGDRYWSASYQDVLDLRRKWESQVTELATMREQLAHLEGIDKVCDHAHETILKMQIELDAREKVIEAVQKLLSEILERYEVYLRKGENSPARWVYGWCSIELESALAPTQPTTEEKA